VRQKYLKLKTLFRKTHIMAIPVAIIIFIIFYSLYIFSTTPHNDYMFNAYVYQSLYDNQTNMTKIILLSSPTDYQSAKTDLIQGQHFDLLAGYFYTFTYNTKTELITDYKRLN
jgi:hypothetical protein